METFWQQVTLFSGLEDSFYDTLSSSANEQTFEKDELIFSAGDPCSSLYVVKSGSVKLYNSRSGTGKEEMVCHLSRNGFFCLAPLISKENFHLNAKALEKTTAYAIPRETIQEGIDQSHDFAKKVILYLAGKECDLCEEVCDLSLSTTKERLAKYLLKQYEAAEKPRSFALQLNQSELASHLGTVRETLSRDLSDLKKAHIIETHKSSVQVIDYEELKVIAHRSHAGQRSFPILADE